MTLRRLCQLTAMTFGTCIAWPGAALGQSGPVPPCAGPPNPAPGAVGAALNQIVWMAGELPDDWSPPDCVGWTGGPTRALLAAAGRFRLAGDSAVLADKLTKFSTLTDMIYWSATRSRWRKLFREAGALSGPDLDMRRDDFAESDFVPGAEFYYWSEENNPTTEVIYQMHVHERTPTRLVFESTNVTPLKAKLLLFRREVAAPGEFRQFYYIEREDDETWRYYSLVRMGRASSVAGTSSDNYRNRAEAFFRFLAGLQMDREPPAAVR